MTLDELLAIAEIVEKLTHRYRDQEAAHKAALTEIRARTSADEKLIEGYRRQIVSLGAANDRLNDLLRVERLAHRDEVAALQERLRASIARGDFAQMEVAALKSQTPNQHGRWVRATSEKCTHAKAGEVVSVRGYLVRTNSGEFLWEGKDCEPCDPPQTAPVPKRAHPVAVGGYLRRLTGFNTTPAGEVARVTLVDDDDASHLEYEVVRPNGQKGRWSAKGCEPCDPPEATHDTEAGKAVAESAVKTEPVAEEIKMGDVAKVVGASGDITAQSDIGEIGEVLQLDSMDGTVLLSGGAGWVNRCDVRKVTT